MNTQTMESPAGHVAGINPGRLFLGSCFALIATAVCFAVVGDIMGALKEQFILTNGQVGAIGGAAIWGFTVSIFIFGPLCDIIGMRVLLRLALVGHVVGVLTMMLAQGYWMLFGGALILSMGNGLVEAVCNPLVTTIYPDRKIQKLNQFHMWFPGGITIGGVLSYFIGNLHLADAVSWKLKLGLILVPAVIYGLLFTMQRFPATESHQSGVSFGGMFKEAFGRPLFWMLLLCMCITASLELGPGRWVPAVLTAGGISGILVLAYGNGLMAILRFFAGPVVHRLSPTGVLLGSAIVGGIGLLMLSFATTTPMAFVSGTVFWVGVCYFWPTMIGVTSERVPKGGSLALALMGGMGMLIVGTVTSPRMGDIADRYAHKQFDQAKVAQTLQKVVATYPALAAKAKGDTGKDILAAVADAQKVLDARKSAGSLPEIATANALRDAIKNGITSSDKDKKQPNYKPTVADEAKAELDPADNYGGRIAFRYVAPFALIIVLVFGGLYVSDKARGGYKAEKIV